MNRFMILILGVLPLLVYAQAPDPPFNPMTAPGARHISYHNGQLAHILYWQNPTNLIYNDVYISQDSNLVINLDPSVKILSGIDSSKVYSSLSLEVFGIIDVHTKYYWRVVEYNSFGFTAGPVWYFISQGPYLNYWEDYFYGDLSNYTILQTQGAVWNISNTNFAGGQAPELSFHNPSVISDTSYLILNSFFDLSPSLNAIDLNYSLDWQSGEFLVGLAYSLDEGISWLPIWQQEITEDVPATQALIIVPNENYVKLAFYCIDTIPNSAGFWYVDNFLLNSPLTIPTPPAQICANSDTDTQKVILSWNPGTTINPSWGYVIQRKNGLPNSPTNYYQIAWVGPNVFSFEDLTVQLDSVYTYRIQIREGPGGNFRSNWSNEATAYVPSVVPVELLSFSSFVVDDDVTLNWSTATETNNAGFQIERSKKLEVRSEEWNSIGFVNGSGTTTKIKSYSYKDENLAAGKYLYRLKQIDLDGTFEYSNIIEAEVLSPSEFILEQNYPNPFNPNTRIQYAIGSKQFVSLKIFNSLGEEVASLVNEEKSAGFYKIDFNASHLSSGIYYYKIIAGDFVQTRKMILIK
ncbi:MAG TPA: T9SS type A sorting domain-containing protein [Ignavibacteriaceae bacterium]|nr:T9SS type A sorting domain-containing protein [Ignavibacteriaceae bacterium]